MSRSEISELQYAKIKLKANELKRNKKNSIP